MTPNRLTMVLGVLMGASLTGMYVLAFIMGADPLPMALVVGAGILALIGGVQVLRTSLAAHAPRAVDVVVAGAATSLSLVLSRGLGIQLLVAGSLVGVVLAVAALGDGPLDVMASAAGYTGMCVGLMTPAITIRPVWVVLAGLVAGALWSVAGPAVFNGVGGRMGVVAYMSASSIYAVADLLGDESNSRIIPSVNGMAHWAVVPIGCAAALVVSVLVNNGGWSFVMASAVSSLLVCGVVVMSDLGPSLEAVLSTAWFGGTFVSGATPRRFPSHLWYGAAGLVYGAFMLHFEGPLEGHVGVIGATAAIGCFVVIPIERFVSARRAGATPDAAPDTSRRSGSPQPA